MSEKSDVSLHDLYDLTGLLLQRIASVNYSLQRLPVNSVSWDMIALNLDDAASCAKELGRRIKNGEIR